MKAVVCRAWGSPETLVIEDRSPLAAEPGKVVVSVKTANVKFSDNLIIQNKYQTKQELPFVPGSEVAGLIKSVGAGVEGWNIGDRVSAQITIGGYAEEVLVEPERLLALPQSMDFAAAAGLASTYGTSYYALTERGELRSGETLLVLGASGGVGLAAVEIGKVIGARVIACASTDEKLAVCREHGADATINYAAEDLRARVREITGGKGLDVVYDPVGGAYSEPALRDLAWGGRFLVIGFAAGDIPKIALNLPLVKGCSIVGVWVGPFIRRNPARYRANARTLYEWFEAGKIRPHVWATYPLTNAADALNAVAGRKVAGKVVLTTDN
jgi:NADPH2:quinone reductase